MRLRLGQAGAGDAQRMHGDVLFIQRRDELLPEPREQQQRAGEQQDGAGDDRRADARSCAASSGA